MFMPPSDLTVDHNDDRYTEKSCSEIPREQPDTPVAGIDRLQRSILVLPCELKAELAILRQRPCG